MAACPQPPFVGVTVLVVVAVVVTAVVANSTFATAATVEPAASAGCVASVVACAAAFVAGGRVSTTASLVTAAFYCPGHPAGKRKEGAQLLSPFLTTFLHS